MFLTLRFDAQQPERFLISICPQQTKCSSSTNAFVELRGVRYLVLGVPRAVLKLSVYNCLKVLSFSAFTVWWLSELIIRLLPRRPLRNCSLNHSIIEFRLDLYTQARLNIFNIPPLDSFCLNFLRRRWFIQNEIANQKKIQESLTACKLSFVNRIVTYSNRADFLSKLIVIYSKILNSPLSVDKNGNREI